MNVLWLGHERLWYSWAAPFGVSPLPILAQLFRPIEDPVAIFLTILAIMLVAPLVFERLRMPGIIGLILAGLVVGPYGLGILERDSSIDLLGRVGLLFLMFLGGLETSLDDLKQNANKAIVFGLASFALPMIIGTAAMLPLGYSPLASILIASCFASHTLLALPLLSKLGIMRTQPVTATLGGTLITNVLALLVLAVVVKANEGDLTATFWLFLIPSLAIYTFATLWGVPRLGRWFFKKFGHDEGAEFTFVLVALFVVSYLANLIEIEPIVGAFLAGIAITQIVPQLSPLMNRIQFIGNTLFVPIFLISVGMLVDPLILIKEPRSILIASVMIGAEMVSKFAAAWGSGALFGWKRSGTMVAFGLSVAQAASTLAAITVALEIGLVDELTVNGIIAMILATCVFSPWATNRWGSRLKPEPANPTHLKRAQLGDRVMVPVANPNTENNLLNLAIILTKSAGGTLLPLHVLSDRRGAISPDAKLQQKHLLSAAVESANAAVINVEPVGRVDDSIDLGIIRSSQEHNASLVICGWKGYSTYRENFLGSVLDNVVRLCPVPILITRFPNPIKNTQRVVLAAADWETSAEAFQQALALVQTLVAELKANLMVLLVWSRGRQPIDPETLNISVDVRVIQERGSLVDKVLENLREDDLLVLIAGSYRFGESVVGRAPETIARLHPETSMIIVNLPKKLEA